MKYLYEEIILMMEKKGYQIDYRDYAINIVGIRTITSKPNLFDDLIIVFFHLDKKKKGYFEFKASTEPGLYYLNNPLNKKGTAILKEGQYINSHQLGLHQGKYEALVQRGMLTVYRDHNKDDKFDFDESKTDTNNNFGINIHRANKIGISNYVNKWSAGCQVIQSPSDFDQFIRLAKLHPDRWFTYTLINTNDYKSLRKTLFTE